MKDIWRRVLNRTHLGHSHQKYERYLEKGIKQDTFGTFSAKYERYLEKDIKQDTFGTFLAKI